MTMFLIVFLYINHGDYMKRIIMIIFMCFVIIFFLGINRDNVSEVAEDEERRSVFISYIEISKYFNCVSEEVAKKRVLEIIGNVKDMGCNEIILQVRSFMDAIYKSHIFPWSRYMSSEEGKDPGYDLLEMFLEYAKKDNISVIAWINPYRVRNDNNFSNVSKDSPVYGYYGTDILYINNGIYLNPSKEETVKLIVDGVREIVKKYRVDGILFDDYFYPDNNVDLDDYNDYVIKHGYIEKSSYNLNVVSDMIKKVYDVCNKYNVKFGVSPDGNIDNNYNKVFADVKRWCSEEGYIDFIMPQIYYGFFNESRPYKETLEEWEKIASNKEFRVALAFYKVGSHDKWAKRGENEWIENSDIIMREILLARNTNNYNGFSLYRYEYLFETDYFTDTTLTEKENIKKVIN